MAEINERELERIVSMAAKKTAEELFERLGLDIANVRDSQADFAYLRKQRLASEQITRLAVRTVVTLFLTGICAVFLLGIKDYLKH